MKRGVKRCGTAPETPCRGTRGAARADPKMVQVLASAWDAISVDSFCPSVLACKAVLRHYMHTSSMFCPPPPPQGAPNHLHPTPPYPHFSHTPPQPPRTFRTFQAHGCSEPFRAFRTFRTRTMSWNNTRGGVGMEGGGVGHRGGCGGAGGEMGVGRAGVQVVGGTLGDRT